MNESSVVDREPVLSVGVAGSSRPALQTVTHALLREPPRCLGLGLTTQELGEPDVDLALEQYEAYVAALRRLNVHVTVLRADNDHPDSHFVEDVAVIHDGVAIMTNPGSPSRRKEVPAMREVLTGIMPVMELGGGPEAHVEGGDVLFVGKKVFIGVSSRTNEPGATQLARRLLEIDPDLSIRQVPLSGVLHLKTGVTALDHQLLLQDPSCRLTVTLPFARTVTLPVSEGYAANVMPINRGMIIAKGSDTLTAVAGTCVDRVITLDISEYRKMDGSLTCLSLLWREESGADARSDGSAGPVWEARGPWAHNRH